MEVLLLVPYLENISSFAELVAYFAGVGSSLQSLEKLLVKSEDLTGGPGFSS